MKGGFTSKGKSQKKIKTKSQASDTSSIEISKASVRRSMRRYTKETEAGELPVPWKPELMSET